MNDYNFYFWLNTLANLMQIETYRLSVEDATNTEINQHLQEQDRILNGEIAQKLDKIISQNDEIIEMLKDDIA